MRVNPSQIELETGAEPVQFGGGDYQTTVYTPAAPVNQPEAAIGTGQYGAATPIAESDTGGASIGLPFLFGQVSNSAPGYDFSGLFGNTSEEPKSSVIARVLQWVRQILS